MDEWLEKFVSRGIEPRDVAMIPVPVMKYIEQLQAELAKRDKVIEAYKDIVDNNLDDLLRGIGIPGIDFTNRIKMMDEKRKALAELDTQ